MKLDTITIDVDLSGVVAADSDSTNNTLEVYCTNMVKDYTKDGIKKQLGNLLTIFRPEDSTIPEGLFVANYIDVETEKSIRVKDGTTAGIDVERGQNLASENISAIEFNPALIRPINKNLSIPNFKVPVRLYASIDNITGDVYWREYFTGGTYANQNFENLIDLETIYYDTAFSIKAPVDYKTARAHEYLNVTKDSNSLFFEIKSNYMDYNLQVQNFQDWALELNSELLIPNYYIVLEKAYRDERLLDEDPTSMEFTKQLQQGYTKQKENVMAYHFPNNMTYSYIITNYLQDQYFGSFFVNYPNNQTFKDAAIQHQQNLIFDDQYFSMITQESAKTEISFITPAKEREIRKKLSTFYHIDISFDRHDREFFDDKTGVSTDSGAGFIPSIDSLNENSQQQPEHQKKLFTNSLFGKFNSRFLELLKDIDEGTITEVPVRTESVLFNRHYDKVTYNEQEPISITQTTELPAMSFGLKTINLLQFLTYAYNNFDVALNDNYLFMGPPRANHAATIHQDTLYKNKNSEDILIAIDACYDLLNLYYHSMAVKIENLISSGLDGATKSVDAQNLSSDLFLHILDPTKKFREVVAYKIEKYSSTPTGDSSTGDLIQKFWVFNSKDAPDKVTIKDCQVKYGKDYTYRIFAYTLVVSHKYKYADFRLTKQIGSGQRINPDDESESPKFCLQFYNPITNEISPQVFTSVPDDKTKDLIESALSMFNEFATSEVDLSLSPQLADFHLMIEPCLELIEVPIYEKTTKVLDNPANAINVTPFHFIDNSGRLGFKIGQDSFIERTYPEIVNTSDNKMRTDYLHSKEILPVQQIKHFSQSPARYIEMYRIKNKPNSFTDFGDNLVSVIDMRIDNGNHNYADMIISDQITTNQKYYYLFRLLNENRVPGPVSQIIKAELVNDGGYIYSLFDTVDSSEFNPNKITTKNISFKKLMQFEPHIKQMMFDTTEMDFTKTASSQISKLKVGVNDQLMWDKKFKIRLTSKKTSKKLDLNVSFNLRNRDLTKLSSFIEPIVDPEFVRDEVPAIPTLPPSADKTSVPADLDVLGGYSSDTPLGGALGVGSSGFASDSDPTIEEFGLTKTQYLQAIYDYVPIWRLFTSRTGESPISYTYPPSFPAGLESELFIQLVQRFSQGLYNNRTHPYLLTSISAYDADTIILGLMGSLGDRFGMEAGFVPYEVGDYFDTLPTREQITAARHAMSTSAASDFWE